MAGWIATLIVPTVLTCLPGAPADSGDQQAQLARHFGFADMQIYKIKPDIADLQLADLNGDGRTDIALWNRWKNRIEIFFQPDADDVPVSGAASELERNEIPSRGNMRNENVPVAYRIECMSVADLTGDGRADIVFFGEPREVVILPAKPGGGFGPPDAIRAPDGLPRSAALTVGDYDNDGRTDVALLGDEQILVFHQRAGGGLNKPQRLVHGVKQTLMLMTADVDGDDRDDLLMSVDDKEYGTAVFCQDADGSLGAMQRVRMPAVRSVTIAANAEGPDDIFCVESATNRLRVLRWQTARSTGSGDWPAAFYSYPIVSKGKRRPIAIGDVTNDGRPDVVAVSVDTAQLILFSGGPDGLAPGKAFPGLVKTRDVRIGDIDGDGRNEVVSVSTEEKMLGVSRYENQRLTFPSPAPLVGTPLAVTIGRLRPDDERTHVVYLTTEQRPAAEGEKKSTITTIRIVEAATGEEVTSWEIDALEDDPAGMRLADVNQDGLNDLLVFVHFSALKTFLQTADGSFEALAGPETRAGLVKSAELANFAIADVTGDGKPEVLLAQKALARALVVRDGRWTIVDQYNPESADADLKGLAALGGRDGLPTLAVHDRNAHELLVMRPQPDKTYAVEKAIPVGSFDVSVMRALRLGDDGREALLMADAKRLAVFRPEIEQATLVEQLAYESDIKDAWLADSVPGDLNHDGVRDVVTVDMRKAYLEILTTQPDGRLVKAFHFQVFQGKRFSAEPERGGQPRQVLIGDVTSDSIDDLVLIVHDRLIVYPGQ